MTHHALVPGSLAAMAQREQTSIAESFLAADAILIIDVSSSMTGAPYDQACAELRRLQADLPGRVAVVSFSDRPEFVPGGVPRMTGGGTDLARALSFVHAADGCDIRFIVISDGAPDDEAAALRAAARFTSRIDCVYIGPPGGMGEDFLRRLAAAAGGRASTTIVGQIAEQAKRLLLAAPGSSGIAGSQ